MTRTCSVCGKTSAIIGYKRDDPVLGCLHVQQLLSPEEMARIATEEATRQINMLMRQYGIDYDAAESLYVEQATTELTEEIDKGHKELLERLAKIPADVLDRRVKNRKERFVKFSTRPRWVGPLIDPKVRHSDDERKSNADI